MATADEGFPGHCRAAAACRVPCRGACLGDADMQRDARVREGEHAGCV